MIEEIWRDIEGFKDYQISNYGNVKSIARTILRMDGRHKTFEEKELKKTGKTSRYTGVYFSTRDKVWSACIYINNKNHGLGSYQTEEDAHLAYQRALNQHGIQNKYAA